jgi:hypothetical protein
MMFRPQLEKTTCATQTSAPPWEVPVRPVNCMHKADKREKHIVYSMQLLAQDYWPNQGENGHQLQTWVCKPNGAPPVVSRSPREKQLTHTKARRHKEIWAFY